MSTHSGGSPTEFTIPDALPVLPLPDAVVFPLTAVPLFVQSRGAIRIIDDVMRGNRLLVFVAQHNEKMDGVTPEDVHRVGTVGTIHQMARTPDGSVRVMVQGIERVRLLDFVAKDPYLVARIERAPEQAAAGPELDGLRRAVVDLFRRLVQLSDELPDELAVAAENLADPRQVVYFVASLVVRPDTASRQALLEMDSVAEKLRRLVDVLQNELAVREIGRKITSDTEQRLSKKQREFILREQAKTIQKELGEDGGDDSEVTDLRRRLEEAALPDEARREAERELKRLTGMQPGSPERGMVITYLEWMVSLPWNKADGGTIDIRRAREVLDEDHFDLDKIKDRILEYLAVRKLRQERGGGTEPPRVTGDSPAREPILCFVGPPGVGKTSLGQSIARALGRKFVRMSLGGVRDEAEIRGHRRTYIGSLPGRIIQGLRRAETKDPVFMLDEIDKIGADWRGDPSSALLEVLDPAQNHTFVDNYLGVPFDLSQVLFIATGNALDTIPGPLRDRMEVLMLSGYTDEEKVGIASQYLVPKQLAANGLVTGELVFEPDAIRLIVRRYTREAGVRNLDREIAAVARKVARRLAGGERGRVPRPPAVLRRGRRAHVAPGRGHRARLDAGRRRRPVRRGHDDAEQRGAPGPHRHARRRHARERPGRRVVRVVQRRGLRHRPQDLRGQDHPRARARRRHPQGRPVRRRHHGHCARVLRHAAPRPQRRRHDRRDHPARQGPARRRHQGKGARRPPRRHPHADPAAPQRARSRGRARGGARGAALRVRGRRGGGGAAGADAGGGGRGGALSEGCGADGVTSRWFRRDAAPTDTRARCRGPSAACTTGRCTASR